MLMVELPTVVGLRTVVDSGDKFRAIILTTTAKKNRKNRNHFPIRYQAVWACTSWDLLNRQALAVCGMTQSWNESSRTFVANLSTGDYANDLIFVTHHNAHIKLMFKTCSRSGLSADGCQTSLIRFVASQILEHCNCIVTI